MTSIILVIHIIIALLLIVLVLLQRSEGGALGIGGGQGGGLMSKRGAGSVLTKATAILAALFFITSISLTALGMQDRKKSLLNEYAPTTSDGAYEAPAPPTLDIELPPVQ